MTAPLAASLYDDQARIQRAAVGAALEVWDGIDPTRFSQSWDSDRIGDQLFIALSRAQLLAALSTDAYVDEIVATLDVDTQAAGKVVPDAFAGVASDGRDLATLLEQAVIRSVIAATAGASLMDAKSAGSATLSRIAGTQVADSGRGAMGVGIAARPKTGWVRLVEPKACSRCIVLAGRFYKWSSGFQRHPLCKCRNIPALEDTPDLRPDNDPMAHFNSLSEAEQNRQFTVAGARAIRDGGDIGRVVNARRGAMGLNAPGALTNEDRTIVRKGGQLVRTDVAGRPVYVTSEGTTIRADYGKAEIERGNSRMTTSSGGRKLTATTTPRLMPESIYEIATDRDDAIRLLRRFGYIR